MVWQRNPVEGDYAINLQVEMMGNTITGTTTSAAQATQPSHSFNLDLLGLAVNTIQVNGRPARFSRSGSELTILPASPLANGAAFLFGAAVYVRGAWSLHALRLRIGDTAFVTLLRTWVKRYPYSNASTPDFIAPAEAVSGQSLAHFLPQWLYQDQVPPLPALTLRDQH
jgi:aminopeptidase N